MLILCSVLPSLLLATVVGAAGRPDLGAAISWVEQRGGAVSLDFAAYQIAAAAPSGLAFVDFASRPIGDAELAGLADIGPIYGINISDTKVTDAGMKEIGRQVVLERVLADKTAIGDIGLGALAPLTELRVLSLYATRITSAGVGVFSGMRRLTSVALDGTKVGSTVFGALAPSGSSLESLSLAHTAVTDDHFADIVGLPRLRRLSLTGNAISDRSLPSLARLTALETLLLDDTKLTSAGAADLAAIASLKELSLNGTAIDDLAEPIFARMNQLRVLSLVGAKFSTSSVARLRLALPNCEIRIGA